MKEYCERCAAPLQEWEWCGRGLCEACEDETNPAAPQPGAAQPETTMTIKNPIFVHDYISMVTELRSALANLAEFVDTLPAPDDDMHIPGMDYPQLAGVGRLHELIGEACEITCEISE